MKQSSLFCRIICTSILVCSIVLLPAVSAKAASTKKNSSKKSSSSAKNEEFAVVKKKVERLVKVYFPRAKFKSTKNGVHFEFKVKNYVASTGSSRRILAPNVDGIVGDISIKEGNYSGTEVLPYKVNEMYWVSLKMAPYSKPQNNHLFTKLLYPPQTPIDFINDFIKVIQSYTDESAKSDAVSKNVSADSETKKNRSDIAKEESKLTALIEDNILEEAKSSESDKISNKSEKSKDSNNEEIEQEKSKPKVAIAIPTKLDAKPDSSGKTQKDVKAKKTESDKDEDDDSDTGDMESSNESKTEATDSENDEKFDFGAPKFSNYSFSEGRFKIKLPGSPKSKASNRGGMRFVDFKYVEAQGLYNIGYAIMPGEVPYAERNKFLNTMANSLVTAAGGKVVSHHSLKWQGYPGRQIKIKNLAGKASKSSLFRIFLVRRYFYILQAAGNNAWLASPAVKTVLNSLVIKPELTSSERSKYRRRSSSYRSKSNYSYSGKSRKYSGNKHSKYNHSRERRRADRKYNRVRYR